VLIFPEKERWEIYEEMHSIDNSRKNAGLQKGGSPVGPEN